MSMTETIYNGLVSYPWDEVNSHHLNRYIQFINAILTKRSENVKFEYSEKHHILPKSMGGSNDKENLIYLSYREHYIAHYMLAKAFPNHNISSALTKMMDGKERIKNSRLYETARIFVSNSMSKRQKENPSAQNKKWMNNSKEEVLVLFENIAQFLENGYSIGRLPMSEEVKLRISITTKGKRTGDDNPRRKHPVTEETKQKLKNYYKKMKEQGLSYSNKNKIAINKDGIIKYIFPIELETFIKLGWLCGGISNKTPKLELAHKNRIGKIWVNNSLTNKLIRKEELDYYIENGYIQGLLRHKK